MSDNTQFKLLALLILTQILTACSIQKANTENTSTVITPITSNTTSTNIESSRDINIKNDNLKDEILALKPNSLQKRNEVKETFNKDNPTLSKVLQTTFSATGQLLAGGRANMGRSPVGFEY